MCQIRLADMPNQAHRYAKSGSRLCQIRLKNKPNQAHMPHKCAKPGIQGQIRLKSGDHYQTHWKENPVILSTPVSDKGIGHTYNEEKQTRGQNAKAERSIIGCETVKIRARTPFGFNDSKHIGINWRIILVNETAQKISHPVEWSRNPLRFQGNTIEPPTVWTLKTPKQSTLAALWLTLSEKIFTLLCLNRSTKESKT